MSRHSPGPWRAEGDQIIAADGYVIFDAGGPHLHESHDADKGHWKYEDGSARDIGEDEEEANARRAAACFNACRNFETETLEQVVAGKRQMMLTNTVTA